MEWVFKEEELADTLAQLMETMEIHAHRMQRKTAWVVYLKDSEEIGTLLAMMGANRAILEHENERIMRQMKNNVQRAVNCGTGRHDESADWKIRYEPPATQAGGNSRGTWLPRVAKGGPCEQFLSFTRPYAV